MDWIGVLEGLRDRGIDFDAFWMGGGSETGEMRKRLDASGLEDRVQLLDFVRDRTEVLARFREIQVFLFCHKTPESPRCLIEALVSGTPSVGYDGSFARDLISDHGGGQLVAQNDVGALTDAVAGLAQDPARLAGLIGRAARDGAPYDDESVFSHRSEIIRKYLGPSRGPGMPARIETA